MEGVGSCRVVCSSCQSLPGVNVKKKSQLHNRTNKDGQTLLQLLTISQYEQINANNSQSYSMNNRQTQIFTISWYKRIQ